MVLKMMSINGKHSALNIRYMVKLNRVLLYELFIGITGFGHELQRQAVSSNPVPGQKRGNHGIKVSAFST